MRTESVDNLFDRFGPSYQLFVTVTGMAASFVMVVSGGIVNVAVPDVMGTFGIGLDQAQLMATAFNVAMTTSQLLNDHSVARFEMDRIDDALTDLTAALAERRFAQALSNRGNCYRRLGRLREARGLQGKGITNPADTANLIASCPVCVSL